MAKYRPLKTRVKVVPFTRNGKRVYRWLITDILGSNIAYGIAPKRPAARKAADQELHRIGAL